MKIIILEKVKNGDRFSKIKIDFLWPELMNNDLKYTSIRKCYTSLLK